ncbi:SagB/ThcOx family dehydrogenase [Blastococcus sp. MG754426]|uniref:nitroreductase family protein n=1 Tax=unclassified Blastococcus TaxID=2619396 RepID=UPI001EEF8BE7|nr:MULTISPECIES: nitroreductase family protein [unclassified Blastococcus]MCF6506872.1 SagB/ThcOx family dehydrogenase [Blastococcus sp. MG754426]MCF6511672.1 SagB/ThcOx family dehydrogenase [Blastococcus sp. MG754427]
MTSAFASIRREDEGSEAGLTLRLRGDRGWVSRDDGATAPLPPHRAQQLTEELSVLSCNSPTSGLQLTATALASLAEARQLRPRVSAGLAATVGAHPVHTLGLPTDEPDTASHLAVPVTDLGPTRPFAEVLATRHSARSFGYLEAGALGTVLARAALTKRAWPGADRFTESSRPTPSAGARQPLTPVVVSHQVIGLPPGLWLFDTDEAVLRPCRADSSQIDRATRAVTDALDLDTAPPATVFLIAQPARTLSRYPGGMSLIWRDTGAMLATLQLAAADLRLSSCIVGTTGALFDCDDDPYGLTDTGALALGGLASAD